MKIYLTSKIKCLLCKSTRAISFDHGITSFLSKTLCQLSTIDIQKPRFSTKTQVIASYEENWGFTQNNHILWKNKRSVDKNNSVMT